MLTFVTSSFKIFLYFSEYNHFTLYPQDKSNYTQLSVLPLFGSKRGDRLEFTRFSFSNSKSVICISRRNGRDFIE